jgi:hypothetical protein
MRGPDEIAGCSAPSSRSIFAERIPVRWPASHSPPSMGRAYFPPCRPVLDIEYRFRRGCRSSRPANLWREWSGRRSVLASGSRCREISAASRCCGAAETGRKEIRRRKVRCRREYVLPRLMLSHALSRPLKWIVTDVHPASKWLIDVGDREQHQRDQQSKGKYLDAMQRCILRSEQRGRKHRHGRAYK